MIKKLKAIFIILPYIAMLSALVNLVKSLFYNFHNDTVPFISIMISVAISLFCVALIAAAGISAVRYLKEKTLSRQLLTIGIVFLSNLIFSAVCLLVHFSQLKLIAIYFLTTTLLLTVSFFLAGKVSCAAAKEKK